MIANGVTQELPKRAAVFCLALCIWSKARKMMLPCWQSDGVWSEPAPVKAHDEPEQKAGGNGRS